MYICTLIGLQYIIVFHNICVRSTRVSTSTVYLNIGCQAAFVSHKWLETCSIAYNESSNLRIIWAAYTRLISPFILKPSKLETRNSLYSCDISDIPDVLPKLDKIFPIFLCQHHTTEIPRYSSTAITKFPSTFILIVWSQKATLTFVSSQLRTKIQRTRKHKFSTEPQAYRRLHDSWT